MTRPRGKMLALALAGLGTTAIMGFVVVVLLISWFSNPPFGLGNAPAQPVAFPHTVHVADNGIQCEFCHRNVTKGEAATVPALEQCLFCHKNIEGDTVTARAEISKVTMAFNANEPINWERVHRLPDHVRFVHEAHIRALTAMTFPALPPRRRCKGPARCATETSPSPPKSNPSAASP